MVHAKTSQESKLQSFKSFFRVPLSNYCCNVEITIAKLPWYMKKELKLQ